MIVKRIDLLIIVKALQKIGRIDLYISYLLLFMSFFCRSKSEIKLIVNRIRIFFILLFLWFFGIFKVL